MENEFKSFAKKTENRKYNTWCRWNNTYSIDTYGRGCLHDCKYCYAKAMLDFRKFWNPKNPAVANIDKIKRFIDKNLKKGDVIRMGIMTDCFQAIESKYNVTYETIKYLNEKGIHYLIVTKSNLVADDRFIEIYDKQLAHFQISITNTNDSKSLEYENAPVPSKRIQAIEKLNSLGFDVCVRLSPFIPEFIDIDVINNIKCDKILIEFLKVSPWCKKWFDIDYSPYTLKCGGYLHLPLDKKIELANKITGFKEKTVGEFVSEHNDWFMANFNTNKNDCCNIRI